MENIYKNKYNIIIAILFFIILFNINSAYAKIGDWDDKLKNSGEETKIYETEGVTDAKAGLSKYIGVLIGWTAFLGLVFMIHLTLAGYEWMTARGNAEKVEHAQKRIRNALVGSIILIALYIIAYYLINLLSDTTGYNIDPPYSP